MYSALFWAFSQRDYNNTEVPNFMAISKTKVAILGVGKVGAALAYHLTVSQICDELVLVDLDQQKAWAEATDLQHSLGFSGHRMNIRDGSYYDCADADICVLSVAAQFPPNTPRLEMIDRAAAMVGRIVPSVMATGFDGIFLVITNPVDLMTWLVQQLSGLPAEHVIGTGTALDTARLRYYLADALDVDPRSVSACVLGEHGENQMIPWSQVSVAGKPLTEILKDNPERLPDFDRDALLNTIADITYQLRSVKGATTYGIASITAEIIKVLLHDGQKILPVSAMLHGEYGHEDVYVGVPAVLGASGVKELVEYHLTGEEQSQFDRAVEALEQYMTDIS